MRKSFIHSILCLCILLAVPALGNGSVRVDNPAEKVNCLEKVFTSQIGVTEDLGANDGYAIRGYLLSTGFDQPVAWCAAFVSWSHTLCGIENPRSAWSPSWFPSSNTIYTRGAPGNLQPTKGDVFGIYFTSYKRVAHVGFVDSWTDDNYCITVEGNTNGAGSREGDGVYKKRRLKSQIYKVSRWAS